MLNKKEFKDIYIKHFDSTRKFVFDRCGDKEMAVLLKPNMQAVFNENIFDITFNIK